jgi:hypothetical protein
MIELFWIDDMKKIWDGVIGTSATVVLAFLYCCA